MTSPRDHPDASIHGEVRGRAAGLNPAGRFEHVQLSVDGDYLDKLHAEAPRGSQVKTELSTDATASVINRVDSPDLSFNWTINPYRGCEHGCIYCYARPTHETLGFSCGLDFETRIIAKPDAPRLLRRELRARRWKGEPIVMSGVTDPYQPIESTMTITRQCLEVMAQCTQPVSVVTKSRLICRDLDLLSTLAAKHAAQALISLTTLDNRLAATMEPRASAPSDRLAAMKELSQAGIPVTVMVAPVIPGLTDHEVPAILQAAADAGARNATWVMLRLPLQVDKLFLDWLQRSFPDRASRVENLIRGMRGGQMYQSRFGERARGTGPVAAQIKQTFEVFARRLGLDRPMRALSSEGFERPVEEGQMTLY